MSEQSKDPHNTGHAIPQWLRDRFDTIERAVMCGNTAMSIFTEMRTKVQVYFEMQRSVERGQAGRKLHDALTRGAVARVNVEQPGNIEWLAHPAPADATELYTAPVRSEQEPSDIAVQVMQFQMKHPSSGETHIVEFTRAEVADGMEDTLYDKLGDLVCGCNGEADHECGDYIHDFDLLTAIPKAAAPVRAVRLPDGFMIAERSIWTEEQVQAATASVTLAKTIVGVSDRDLAMAAIDAAQCKAPDLTLEDLALLNAMPVYTEYVTTPAESVAGIAARQLGDQERWIEIRDLNALHHPDIGPHDYYPVGTKLRMPAKA